jgi:hypothetical protein
MDAMSLSRLTRLYLALALAQAAHSIEEMRAHLYEFFDVIAARWPAFPMRNVPADTFAVNNLLIIAALLALVPFVQAQRRWALALAGFVAVIEVLNGLAHPAISLSLGRYMPGAFTAPLLFVLGLLFLRELWRSSAESPS